MTFATLDDRSDHVPSKDNPNHSDGNINRPFEFGVFFGCSHTQRQRNGSSKNNALPSPEMYPAKHVAEHTRLEKALHRIVDASKHGITNKCKYDCIGMQWTYTTECCILGIKIENRINKLNSCC